MSFLIRSWGDCDALWNLRALATEVLNMFKTSVARLATKKMVAIIDASERLKIRRRRLKRSSHDPPRFVDFWGSQQNRLLVRWGYNMHWNIWNCYFSLRNSHLYISKAEGLLYNKINLGKIINVCDAFPIDPFTDEINRALSFHLTETFLEIHSRRSRLDHSQICLIFKNCKNNNVRACKTYCRQI